MPDARKECFGAETGMEPEPDLYIILQRRLKIRALILFNLNKSDNDHNHLNFKLSKNNCRCRDKWFRKGGLKGMSRVENKLNFFIDNSSKIFYIRSS